VVREFLIDSRPELMRFLALRVRDELESKDLAQEVYLRTMRLDQVHLIRNSRVCLFRVARNCHGHRHEGREECERLRIRDCGQTPGSLQRSRHGCDIELDLDPRIPT
jgi:DNA-directed RNA polymerase specialized sigma24 family protein